MNEKQYYVYILTNRHHTTLYVGVTGSLFERVKAHKEGRGSVFTRKYNLHKLVHLSAFTAPYDAINFEKKVKKMSRSRKELLIEEGNPQWNELSDLW